jgi:large subunit ribosomal protein L3
MINSFFGIKKATTRMFDEKGNSVVVTDIAVEPMAVVQVKTTEKDGYNAIQVGMDFKTTKKAAKPLLGHVKKLERGTNFVPRFLREIRLKEAEALKINDSIAPDQVFKTGDMVKVTGTSKAKGFQGGVKRHGFKGGPRTHGQSDRERAPGSIGQTTTPGRVYKGKRMAGRMGREIVTTKGLKIMAVDTEKKLLRVSGVVPGMINRLIEVTKQL